MDDRENFKAERAAKWFAYVKHRNANARRFKIKRRRIAKRKN